MEDALIANKIFPITTIEHAVRGCFSKTDEEEVVVASRQYLRLCSFDMLDAKEAQELDVVVRELHVMKWHQEHKLLPDTKMPDIGEELQGRLLWDDKDLLVVLTMDAELIIYAWHAARFQRIWYWKLGSSEEDPLEGHPLNEFGHSLVSTAPWSPAIVLTASSFVHTICPQKMAHPDSHPSSLESLPVSFSAYVTQYSIEKLSVRSVVQIAIGFNPESLIQAKCHCMYHCLQPFMEGCLTFLMTPFLGLDLDSLKVPKQLVKVQIIHDDDQIVTIELDQRAYGCLPVASEVHSSYFQVLSLEYGVREHKNHILTFVLISSGALTIPIGRDEILRQVQNHSKLIKEHLARSKEFLLSGCTASCHQMSCMVTVSHTNVFKFAHAFNYSLSLIPPYHCTIPEMATMVYRAPTVNIENTTFSSPQLPLSLLHLKNGWLLCAPIQGIPIMVSSPGDKSYLERAFTEICQASNSTHTLFDPGIKSLKTFAPEFCNMWADVFRPWEHRCSDIEKSLQNACKALASSDHPCFIFTENLVCKLDWGLKIEESVCVCHQHTEEVVAIGGDAFYGALHFIPASCKWHTMPVTESMPLDPVTAIWSLKLRAIDTHHSLVLLSFANASRALQAGKQMDDVSEEVRMSTNEQTIACGLIGNLCIAQITPTKVTCCSLAPLQEKVSINKRSAVIGITSGLSSLEMQDEMQEECSSLDSPSFTQDQQSSLNPTSLSIDEYSDGIWVPEEGGPISTGACAESLVVVCQDRLLTILHLKEQGETLKRKRGNVVGFVLRVAKNSYLEASASCIALSSITEGEYTMAVAQHQCSVQIMNISLRSGSECQFEVILSITPSWMLSQLRCIAYPSVIRNAEDGDSVNSIVITYSGSNKDLHILLAWRQGIVMHVHASQYNLEVVDVFELGSSVPMLHPIRTDNKLVLGAGSESKVLDFQEEFGRFKQRRLSLPDSRLACPVVTNSGTRKELLIGCISNADELTFRQCADKSPYLSGMHIESRPLGCRPTHIVHLPFAQAIAVSCALHQYSSTDDTQRNTSSHVAIFAENGHGKKSLVYIPDSYSISSMTFFGKDSGLADEESSSESGSATNGVCQRELLVIGLSLMEYRRTHWTQEPGRIIFLSVWMQDGELMIKDMGMGALRYPVLSLGVYRQPGGDSEEEVTCLAMSVHSPPALIIASIHTNPDRRETASYFSLLPQAARRLPSPVKFQSPNPFSRFLAVRHPEGGGSMIGIQSLLDTRFLQGISQPFDRRPCQILSTSCRSELVAIVNLVDDNADIQQIEDFVPCIASKSLLTGDTNGDVCLWGPRRQCKNDFIFANMQEKGPGGTSARRRINRHVPWCIGNFGSSIRYVVEVDRTDSDTGSQEDSQERFVIITTSGEIYSLQMARSNVVPELGKILENVQEKLKSVFTSQDDHFPHFEGKGTSVARNETESILDGDFLAKFHNLDSQLQDKIAEASFKGDRRLQRSKFFRGLMRRSLMDGS